MKMAAMSVAGAIAPGSMLGIGRFAHASTADYRATVCINLAGGNDSNNLIVARDDARYRDYSTARGSLALAHAELAPITAGSSGGSYGLHPRLSGLRMLFTRSQLAVVANVGTLREPASRDEVRAKSVTLPDQLFSHSSQHDQWQSPGTGHTTWNGTGWGGLIADALRTSNSAARYPSVASVAGAALFCDGRTTRPAAIQPGNLTGLRGFPPLVKSSQNRRRAMDQLLAIDLDNELVAAASLGAQATFEDIETLRNALANQPPLQTPFPGTSIGQQLAQIAKVIQARSLLGLTRQVFYASFGSFDTHADQLQRQAALYTDLDGAMTAFYRATVELGVASQVLSFTMSDFGRTLKPSNGGSDHAWGSHHLIMGGSVQGGNVYGAFPSLVLGGADDADERGRFIPTTSVDQYAATIAAWMGVSGADLAGIFPNLRNFSTPLLNFV